MPTFGLISFPVMDYGPDGNLRSIGMDMVRECPPLSLYWLPEVLRLSGIETTILDLIAPGRPFARSDLQHFDGCDVIGLSSTSMSWPTVLRGAKMISEAYPEKVIVFGGPHPTMFDEYILQYFPKSYVIRGEAEVALPALINALRGRGNIDQIPSLTYKNNGQVIKNNQAKKISRSQLSSLPAPNYSYLPNQVYQGLSIESSRGCPFDCSFCSTNYRNSYRPLTPDLFVDKLEHINVHTSKSILNMVHVVDDEFTMNQGRVISIADKLNQRGTSVRLSYDARANDIHNAELVEKMVPFTHEFLVGAECGYDEGLERIGKGTTTKSIRLAAQTLAKFDAGHKAHFSFIIGLPWEGLQEIKRTISFAAELAGTYGVKVLLQWYVQIPGSNLWAEARSKGKVSARFYDDFGYFRNPHLFFSAVRVTPDDIWRLSDLILALKWTLRARHRHVQPLAYHVPGAVMEWFPRDYQTGFSTLRNAVA